MDSVIHTRSSGIGAEGVKDQYADGTIAKVYEVFIGDEKARTKNYKEFLINLLKEKKCKRILDLACGTGIDSIMLLEEGFDVVSVDASDKMLKYAWKTRWERRKEKAFDNWIIEEANWLTLLDDIDHLIGDGFDAVICFGSSFAHLLDSYGDQREHRQALSNFERCVKPGGLLLIDHRNYDQMIATGQTPTHCIYYNSENLQNVVTSVLYTDGKPSLVVRKYRVLLSGNKAVPGGQHEVEFKLSFYPHKLKAFTELLDEAFHHNAKHTVYGDFKPLDHIKDPIFYIHILEKNK